MAAVINRALDDLRSINPKLKAVEKDRAMAFVLSEDCEAWCLELGIDYEIVKEQAAVLYRRIIGNDPAVTSRRSRRIAPSTKPRTPTTAKGRRTR
jgi:hypothetical protein